MEDWFRVTENAVQINLKITPGASKNEITEIRDGRLCVRIAAAAENGKANDCLCAFLAKAIGCAKRDVVLIKGEKSRLKTISLPAACGERLEKAVGAGLKIRKKMI